MDKFFPQIAQVLDGVPGKSEVSIWLAQDGLQNIFNSSWTQRDPASSAVTKLKAFGGHDNVTALLQAWEWAAVNSNSVVIWIHGAQPVLLTGVESLKQRLDWRGAEGPNIIDVAIEPGPNLITEKLASTSAINALHRFGNLNDDLERLFGTWSNRRTEYRYVRAFDDQPNILEKESSAASSHIVRLWAFHEIKQLIKARKISDAVKLASLYQLVTPVSGAVVLETKQHFEDAGLTPVDPLSVPSIPEPSTWALLIIGIALLSFHRRIRICFSGGAR